MNNLKIKTDHSDNRISSVILNDEEISYKISGLTLQMRGGDIPKALIEVPLDNIEVEGDFEVLRKIPKEKCDNNGIELVINGVTVDKDVDSEDLAKAIMDNFNNSSYRQKG